MLDGGQEMARRPPVEACGEVSLMRPCLDQLPGYLGHAGRGQLTQLGNFDPRDGPLQVNEAIDDRTVYLLDKIYVCICPPVIVSLVLCSVR